MVKRLPRSWGDIHRDWPTLTAYPRFETTVALLLTIVISAVILIAQLAIVRKLIVADFYAVTPAWLAGVAALVLALGITYWLMRDRDDRPSRPVPAGRTY